MTTPTIGEIVWYRIDPSERKWTSRPTEPLVAIVSSAMWEDGTFNLVIFNEDGQSISDNPKKVPFVERGQKPPNGRYFERPRRPADAPE